jgi:hypothetical protein
MNKKIYESIAKELDEVPLSELPDEVEFAKDIVQVLPEKSALEAIDAYTAYVCDRTYRVTKE